jgi:5-methylcytosine-specific restriction enzyme subunit McrC
LLGLLTEVHELAGLVPNLVGYDTSTEIVDLLIQIFLQQVDQLVRGGLKKSYLDFEEELTAVRDRIDVRQTMTSQLRGRPKVFCRFEEFSLDGPENRTLLATLWTIVRCAAVLPERRRFAHRLTADFEHVSTIQVEPVNPTTIQCDRLTMHYEPVLRLAHVILASLGITHEFGHLQAEGFQLNMNSLFEKFVFRRLRKELTPQSLRVTDQTSFDFDEQSQANIRPDILIRSRSGKRLVADTKYKLSSKPDPDDLYQILAYCRVLQIDRGLLITAGSSTNLTYSVRDGQTTIDVVSVDLSGSLDDVHESMQKLAQFIIDCLHKPA